MTRPKRPYKVKRINFDMPETLYQQMMDTLKDDTGRVPKGALTEHLNGLIRRSLKVVNLETM